MESDEDDFETDDGELDDESSPDNKTNLDSNDDFKGLVGLQNLGNTCYMNGALQALSNCQQLTRFVLDCPGFVNDTGLSRSYSELIKEIWNSNNSQCAVPTSIIRNIKCIYPAFRGCTQQDTQEFLRCFLEQLHDELRQPKIQKKSDGAKLKLDDESGDDNSCNNVKEISSATTTTTTTDSGSQRSIISDTFEFKISSSVVCSSCNNISTTKETFKDLSIPIPARDHPYYQASDSCINEDNKEVQQLSYVDSIPLARWFIDWFSQLGNWFWGPQVTLYDCLSIFFGTDPLEGDNEYSCDVCTKKNKGVKYLKILELPEVLCIHFKRYESVGSAKITTHVSFPLTGLDLAPFMSTSSRQQCTTYNLIACICHHGSALLNGHYTTYALNCYDGQWYEFDDQHVTNVSSYQVENSEAYILFYQRSTMDDSKDRQRVKASKLLRKSLQQNNYRKYFISKQWINKFNTFVEPGPITNCDFLCEHGKVAKSRETIVGELCHPISESVWDYLKKLHGGGPDCCELIPCELCE